jgi:hypothetical protein
MTATTMIKGWKEIWGSDGFVYSSDGGDDI